jgi:nucleotide-binding universal stress UspA family protein
MPGIKRMLVPTDFSPTSDMAFNYAVDLAAREGSSLQALHVIDDGSLATAYPDGFYVELPGLRAQLTEEAERRLDEMVARCTARGVTATKAVKVGRPAPLIVDTATTCGTDLIVMATHGRTGFAHLMLGSVAERVLRVAPCPVLTVRDTARVSDALAEAVVHQEPARDAQPERAASAAPVAARG